MTPVLVRSETMKFLNSVSIMFARTGPSEYPIETPSSCSYRVPLHENIVLVHESRISFLRVDFQSGVSRVSIWSGERVAGKRSGSQVKGAGN